MLRRWGGLSITLDEVLRDWRGIVDFEMCDFENVRHDLNFNFNFVRSLNLFS